jgi:hypothetical protein
MLFDFQIELAAKKFVPKSRRNRISMGRGENQFNYCNNNDNNNNNNSDNNVYFTQGKRFHRCKTYRHFGYTSSTDPYRTIDWIESNIPSAASNGIADHRKITIELVLAPYLVNVKKCDYDTAYNIIANWLDKCGKIRRLDFNPRYRINYALKRANSNTGPLYPMKQETIKSNYPQMYTEIFFLCSSPSSSAETAATTTTTTATTTTATTNK